ncbi:hypothetical protein RHGRI_012028 [Rhododendron griersonianum]|uniref:Aminotransferase-like plant mobile domain-containing protein n=1 Tax=Rhododendron griersonianum TaxID=479676 RepID=A0AAV6KP31_9ERIC|nr:hypothetical protein RHGRI_012028 [Rhododendron griersonianum]
MVLVVVEGGGGGGGRSGGGGGVVVVEWWSWSGGGSGGGVVELVVVQEDEPHVVLREDEAHDNVREDEPHANVGEDEAHAEICEDELHVDVRENERESDQQEDEETTQARERGRGRGRGRQARQDKVDDEAVGPQDRSLLVDFRNHVAVDIWNGKERPLLKLHSHGRNLKKWSIAEANERLLMRVRSSGLFPLSQIISSYCNKVLLSAFVERWHPETNSFHFRFGEMTITLDDVPQLVGLQVEGLAVHAVKKTREECLAMVQRCLGVEADVAENKVTTNNHVEFEWLIKYEIMFSNVVLFWQFGMVQLVPGPPLVPLRGSIGVNSHSYSVVYAYTFGQWENWRDHVMNVEKRVPIHPRVPWESHPDYLPWFLTVSHFRVSPRPVEVPYTESAEERNAAALAILDSVLGGTRATTSTCLYELRQALVEVRRTLRGPEAPEASIAGPSSDHYLSHYTRCRRRDRT